MCFLLLLKNGTLKVNKENSDFLFIFQSIYFIQIKLDINHIYINYVEIFYYFLIIQDIKLIHKFFKFKNKCNLLTGKISQQVNMNKIVFNLIIKLVQLTVLLICLFIYLFIHTSMKKIGKEKIQK